MCFLHCSCVLSKANKQSKTALDPVTTEKNRFLFEDENNITSTDSSKTVEKLNTLAKKNIDTLIWTDTLHESIYKKIIVKHTKIGDNPSKTDTLKTISTNEDVLKEKINQTREGKLKDVYNVAIVQPFMSKIYLGEELPAQSLRAVEFYEGVKLAFDSLNKENIKLNIRVLDSQKEVEDLDSVLKELDKQDWDVIIGPNSSAQLQRIAEYGKSRKITVVSPFNSNSEITNENNYYIQINPGLFTQSQKIAKFLNGNIKLPVGLSKTNFLVVGTDEDSFRISKIQEAYKLEKADPEAKLPELISGENISIASMRNFLSPGALNVVIVASEKNETFVFGCLRELSSLYNIVDFKKGYRFLVLGSSHWKFFERVNYEYYDNLDLHFTEEFYIDKEDRKIEQFEKSYRNVYGIAPRQFAYVGFDLMLYLGRMLKKYGNGFADYLINEPWQGRHTRFKIEPVYQVVKVLDGNSIKEEKIISHYENQFLNLIKFSDFEFVPVTIKDK